MITKPLVFISDRISSMVSAASLCKSKPRVKVTSFLPSEVRLSIAVPGTKFSKDGSQRYPQLNVIIGREVIAALRWEIGDPINMRFDADGVYVTREERSRWHLHLTTKSNPNSQIKATVSLFADTESIGKLESSMPSAVSRWDIVHGGLLVDWPTSLWNGDAD
jgi:hypothetical protein